jgi:hypothetical protein
MEATFSSEVLGCFRTTRHCIPADLTLRSHTDHRENLVLFLQIKFGSITFISNVLFFVPNLQPLSHMWRGCSCRLQSHISPFTTHFGQKCDKLHQAVVVTCFIGFLRLPKLTNIFTFWLRTSLPCPRGLQRYCCGLGPTGEPTLLFRRHIQRAASGNVHHSNAAASCDEFLSPPDNCTRRRIQPWCTRCRIVQQRHDRAQRLQVRQDNR